MGKKIKFKNKPYNKQIQIAAMKAKFPLFKAVKCNDGQIEFTGDLIVLPELPIYTISILYRGSLRPLVKIIKPQLVADPPHYYKATDSLCLYHPDDYKWKQENLIANEIIEWTRGWIYFYEVWKQYNRWYGPVYKH